jgi:hypothetical protein
VPFRSSTTRTPTWGRGEGPPHPRHDTTLPSPSTAPPAAPHTGADWGQRGRHPQSTVLYKLHVHACIACMRAMQVAHATGGALAAPTIRPSSTQSTTTMPSVWKAVLHTLLTGPTKRSANRRVPDAACPAMPPGPGKQPGGPPAMVLGQAVIAHGCSAVGVRVGGLLAARAAHTRCRRRYPPHACNPNPKHNARHGAARAECVRGTGTANTTTRTHRALLPTTACRELHTTAAASVLQRTAALLFSASGGAHALSSIHTRARAHRPGAGRGTASGGCMRCPRAATAVQTSLTRHA